MLLCQVWFAILMWRELEEQLYLYSCTSASYLGCQGDCGWVAPTHKGLESLSNGGAPFAKRYSLDLGASLHVAAHPCCAASAVSAVRLGNTLQARSLAGVLPIQAAFPEGAAAGQRLGIDAAADLAAEFEAWGFIRGLPPGSAWLPAWHQVLSLPVSDVRAAVRSGGRPAAASGGSLADAAGQRGIGAYLTGGSGGALIGGSGGGGGGSGGPAAASGGSMTVQVFSRKPKQTAAHSLPATCAAERCTHASVPIPGCPSLCHVATCFSAHPC
jgi:hypothetical protein